MKTKEEPTIPFSKRIDFIECQSYTKPTPLEEKIKSLKRKIFLLLTFQHKHIKQSIPENSSILWIHNTTDNIGDSLMKTSSIRYLTKNNHSVDLCVPPHLIDLYKNNNVCNKTFSTKDLSTQKKDYTIIIVDSLSSKCIKVKKHFFRDTPFITLYEHFNYARPDYNLILFSWYRIQFLLGKDEEISHIAKPFTGTAKTPLIDKKEPFTLAIVCGGIDEYRTFQNWPKIIQEINRKLNARIILVGSDNGLDSRDKILSKTKATNIRDTVGQYAINETSYIISQCDLIIGPDGGLLQIANALDVKIIALFAQIRPELRFTKATRIRSLYSTSSVNEIPTEKITKHILEEYYSFIKNDHNTHI